MARYTLGSQIEIHENFEYGTTCALCARKLGKDPKTVLVDENSTVISRERYNELAAMGGYISTTQIGSTCINKFGVEVFA